MQAMIDQAMQLAIGHHQAGRLGEAEEIYRRVLREQPENPDALHLLGVIALQVGQFDKAIELIRHAIQIDPVIADFHNNLGNAFRAKKMFEEAIPFYREAVRLKPDLVVAQFNLGNTLHTRGLTDEAISALRRTIAIKPDYVEAYNNLGNALRDNGQLDESIAAFERALQLKPDLAEAYNNLGNTLRDKGLVDEAIAAFREAIRIAPDLAEAHFSLSAALLLKGDFTQGWSEAEWRWRCERFAGSRRYYVQPRWKGEPLDGKTILLYADAGFGDTILFVRYASMVANRGGKVVLECQPQLARLLEGFAGVERVIATGEPAPRFDAYCPLFGLPLAFGSTLESMPANVPYLKADADITRRWAARLGTSGGKRIGIVWAGNPYSLIDRKRSISLSHFAALEKVPGITFYSLQKGEAAMQASHPPAGMRLIDYTDELSDFADTAGLIANLDLVIAAESAVAHLAGAMGKPVWVLTPFAPDWRWLLGREDSPWFATMRLFRQASIGDWQGVMDRVASSLFEFVEK